MDRGDPVLLRLRRPRGPRTDPDRSALWPRQRQLRDAQLRPHGDGVEAGDGGVRAHGDQLSHRGGEDVCTGEDFVLFRLRFRLFILL